MSDWPTSMSDVVVVGGGVAGLVAARDLVARGARLTVLEAAPAAGGCIATHDVAGLRLDAGAESFSTRGRTVAGLIEELGLADTVVTPATRGAWVALPDGPVPLPAAGVLGIPADPRAPEVRRAIGLRGTARAALDRYLPGRIGLPPGPTTVADLVRARMGRRVLDRLVAPVVSGVYSAPPDRADLDTVLPGIRALIRQTGSLAAAAGRQRALAPAGSAVAGLAGGMYRLVDALLSDLAERGAEVRTRAAVERLEAVDGAGWRLGLVGGEVVHARTVVLAVPGPVAEHLLEPLVPEVLALGGPAIDVVLATLVADVPALDAAPRGTGVLVADGVPGVRAKALTHATAKWAWLADKAGPGRHVLRLSYRAEAPARSDRSLPDPLGADVAGVARADAAALLGVRISPEQVVGVVRTRWAGVVPTVRAGHHDAATALREALDRRPGLYACGAWVSGAGLAAVVADARAQAARIRP